VLAIAVRGGLLQVRQFQRLEAEEGHARGPDLVLLGSRQRFVPTVTTIVAAALALVPLIIYGNVSGLEMVNPLAVVIVGGLATAALLNLFVVPVLYLRFVGAAVPATSTSGEPTREQSDATQ
jgi:Cu/Ag efflux pump CusA